MFYGISEAIDLSAKYFQYNKEDNLDELNILLFGAGDPRSVLKTISNNYQTNKAINFYIIEGSVDIFARDLILLGISLEDDPDKYSCLTKTHLFMDIYGNTLLRPSSFQYLAQKAGFYIKAITDLDWASEYCPIFDFSMLKYRERDWMEKIFNFYKGSEQMNLKQQWNDKLRNYLGTRFDSRKGAFDWDLHMELKERGGKPICNQEYFRFRESGNGFEFPEYEQSFENKTMSIMMLKDPSKGTIKKWQFVGDITVGPFVAFGLHSEYEKLLRSSYGENDYRATDITEINILEMMHQIESGQKLENAFELIHKLGMARFKAQNIENNEQIQIEIPKTEILRPQKHFPNIKIKFLSPDLIRNLPSQSQFNQFFDIVFVGCNYFSFLNQEFKMILKEKAVVCFETLQLSLLKKETRNEFLDQIKSFANQQKLNLKTNLGINKFYTILDYRNDP